MLANRSQSSKVATPRTSKEGLKRFELHLPSDISFLDDREASVSLMRQLLSEADEEKMNDGDLQNHFDNLLWNNLKGSIQTMGLFYRTADKVVHHQKKVAELEKKNQEREKKLMNIDQRFKEVKVSAEDLIAELQNTIKTAKDGAEMTKVIVDRYTEAQAKISTLETDKISLELKNSTLDAEKASLVQQIEDAYERATVKARYDLLKQYKQGLLVEAEVEEEIELYELLDGPDESAQVEPPVQASEEVQPPILEDTTQDRDVRE